ncbi:uncharacterized protein Bfra_005621 [Botrytis fragariae]|uniref:Uncharacterized protein n=1 Tax=Botrytis fragariae TaxID=1964551 RepID=A0A8H6EHN4_9HELO|nr:uncharacterized protein Bfra_005621 [Botrytis fragariae]KAF5872265.1 hypothetical protein Bfra_005621 [Botrytis fragariae]
MNGNYSNRSRSKKNRSNGISLNGNFSHGNLSNGNSSHENLSNGSSHSPAPQHEWKNLFKVQKKGLEKCQAELQESQLECLQLQEQCEKLQESYKELQEAWSNLWIEQERDWQLRTETARAFREFQTAYEAERIQRLPTKQARKVFHDMLYQRGLQLGSGTAQNTTVDSNPFNSYFGRSAFENLVQRAMPDQSLPLRPTLNPAAPVFSGSLNNTHSHYADSTYQSSSSQEGGKGKEPEMFNDSGVENGSEVTSPLTPLSPSQTTFMVPRMRPKFPRRHNSDSYLTDMRAGRASTPE